MYFVYTLYSTPGFLKETKMTKINAGNLLARSRMHARCPRVRQENKEGAHTKMDPFKSDNRNHFTSKACFITFAAVIIIISITSVGTSPPIIWEAAVMRASSLSITTSPPSLSSLPPVPLHHPTSSPRPPSAPPPTQTAVTCSSVCACVRACALVYVRGFAGACMHVRLRECVHTCVFLHAYVRDFALPCACVCLCACMCTCVSACVHGFACVRECIYVCLYLNKRDDGEGPSQQNRHAGRRERTATGGAIKHRTRGCCVLNST